VSLGEVEKERVFCKVSLCIYRAPPATWEEKGTQVILYQHSLFFRRWEGVSSG